jgi:hypothetical protein
MAIPKPRNPVMVDEPVAPPVVEDVPSHAGAISAIASAAAPFIYFDGVPNYGFRDGIATMTLEALRHSSVNGQILTDRIVVGHVRISLRALHSLKMAIQAIELMISPPPEGEKN